MKARWKTIARAAALSMLIVTAGCADAGNGPTAPADLAPSAALFGGSASSFQLVQGLFPNPSGNGMSCDAKGGPDSSPARLRSAAWITPLGGVVALAGGQIGGKLVAHVLTVPPLAVTSKTLFCMRLEPTNHMQVHLQAHAVDLRGKVVDVGAAGFRIPVTLSMSSLSLNLSDALSRRLVIVYDPENGNPLVKMNGVSLPLLDLVIAELPHFSKYAMAVD